MSDDALSALRDAIAAETRFGGAPLELHDVLDSTATRITRLADEGAPHGTLVLARRQKKGRGRRGNSWASPKGGLWFSLLLRHQESFEDAPTSLLAGYAVSQAVDEVARVATTLKWPNDILLNGKKIGGVIAESGRDAAGPRLLLGIGVNVNLGIRDFPFMLRASVTSLQLETGREHDPGDLLVAILSWLDGHLLAREEGKGPYLIGQISDRMPLVGKEIRATEGRATVRGQVIGLTRSGALMVQTKEGRRSLHAGEVEEVRPS